MESADPISLVYNVTLLPVGAVEFPGHGMSLRIWIPKGDFPAHSLKCILLGPAGSDLKSGKDIVSAKNKRDIIPYLEAGHVVVSYSLDGAIPEESDEDLQQFFEQLGYWRFRQAQAGLINTRNAMEFSLQRIDLVNPNEIFVAGHSSAATLALLFASLEPRVAGCIAFAPDTDLNSSRGITPSMQIKKYPGLYGFLQRSSPITFVAQLKCPTFLFHAKDDDVVKLDQIQEFVGKLKESNSRASFHGTDTGGHYDSMIDKGLPEAVKWLSVISNSADK